MSIELALDKFGSIEDIKYTSSVMIKTSEAFDRNHIKKDAHTELTKHENKYRDMYGTLAHHPHRTFMICWRYRMCQRDVYRENGIENQLDL